MKRFIKKVGLFLILFILMWGIIIGADFLVIKNQYLHNYQASILDKIDRIKNITEPKIVLVGNSNVSFGFDSELLEKELGMPVVNTGIHSGLSNMFQEDMVKPYINEGDVVLLAHNGFNDGYKISDPSLAWITLEKHTELWSIIRESNRKEMVQSYPIYALNCFLLWISRQGNKSKDSCYARESFNEYGDIIYRPDHEKRASSTMFYKGAINVPKISDDTVSRINEFNQYVLEKGASLFVVGYPIADGPVTPPMSDYEQFQSLLSEKIDCPVISDYTDYFYPYDYFYNTILHLTNEGVKERTMQTAKDLKSYYELIQTHR